jgi:hypothetical protein
MRGNGSGVRKLPIVFASEDASAGLEIRVNFGVFAGREATPAELDELGHALRREVSRVAIVSEHRHELDGATETSLHQVRVDIPEGSLPEDEIKAESTHSRLVRLAESWARGCIDDRHAEVIELFPGDMPSAR